MALALSALLAAAWAISGCKPACSALDLASKACVIIETVDANGAKVEVKVPGYVAQEYLNTGRMGVVRCK
jgi:hypothetical protein